MNRRAPGIKYQYADNGGTKSKNSIMLGHEIYAEPSRRLTLLVILSFNGIAQLFDPIAHNRYGWILQNVHAYPHVDNVDQGLSTEALLHANLAAIGDRGTIPPPPGSQGNEGWNRSALLSGATR